MELISICYPWSLLRERDHPRHITRKEKTQYVFLDQKHNITDRAQARSTNVASGGASTVETDSPECGQPTDRGQLKTR